MVLRTICNLDRRPGRRPAANAAHKSFKAGELSRCFKGVFIGHGYDFVDDADVQNAWDEPGADALNHVLARLQWLAASMLGDYRTDGRFDGHDLHSRLACFQNLADPRDCSARPDASHKDIDLAGRIAPNLLGRGLAMNFRIRRVVKLLWDEESLVA